MTTILQEAQPLPFSIVEPDTTETLTDISAAAPAPAPLIPHVMRQVTLEPFNFCGGANGYVYLMKSSLGPYKIGITVDLPRRLRDFSTLPFDVFYVCAIYTDNMRSLETQLHKRFASKRLKGEWFDLTRKDVFYIQCMALESGEVYVYRAR